MNTYARCLQHAIKTSKAMRDLFIFQIDNIPVSAPASLAP
jgi:hypothetical protein